MTRSGVIVMARVYYLVGRDGRDYAQWFTTCGLVGVGVDAGWL